MQVAIEKRATGGGSYPTANSAITRCSLRAKRQSASTRLESNYKPLIARLKYGYQLFCWPMAFLGT